MNFRTKMKKIGLLTIAAACCIFTSCNRENQITLQEEEETAEEGNVIFRFETPETNASILTRGSDVVDEGEPEERKLNTVILYLFDAGTKSFFCSYKIDNLTEEKSAFHTKKFTIEPGRYDIFAVGNAKTLIQASNEDELFASIDAETYKEGQLSVIPDGGFLMTNRDTTDLTWNIEKKVKGETVQEITISLDRCVARMEVAKSDEVYELKDEVDIVYAKVSVDSCYFLNLATSFYTFRHAAELNDLTEPSWTVPVNFVEISRDTRQYICDPYFFKKKVDSEGFDNADKFYVHHQGMAGKEAKFSALTQEYKDNRIYGLENCTLQEAQKNGYSTGILFKASLTPNDNVWKLESGELQKASAADYDTLYYINYNFYTSVEALIKKGVKATTDMSEDDLLKLGVKTFKGSEGKFTCYYKYWIRHFDNNNPTVMGVMEFGIVRNNLYKMKVSKISGLGAGKIEDDPDTPDENETYISVSLNVNPWIIRDNQNITL